MALATALITSSRPASRRIGTAVLLGIILVQRIVLAEPGDRNAAEALFRAGRDAMKAGNYALACSHFEQSNQLDPGVGTWLNLGVCEEKLGKLASAWNHYQKVLRALPEHDPRHDLAARRLTALEPHVSRLVIRLAHDAPAATTVTCDGKTHEAESFGVPLAVAAGSHTIVVTSEGRIPRHYEILVPQGQGRELIAEPGPAPAPSSPALPSAPVSKPPPRAAAGASSGATASTPLRDATAEASKTAPAATGSSAARSRTATVRPSAWASNQQSTPSHARTWGWAFTGAGVGFLAVSGVTGRMVIERRSTVERECSEDKICTAEGIKAGEQGKALSWVSTGAFVLGGAGLGVGLYLLLAPDRAGNAPRTQASPIQGGLMITHMGSFDFE